MSTVKLGILLTLKDQASKGLDKSTKSLQGYRKVVGMVGTAMMGTGIAVGGASIKMAADFDRAMHEVNTMMNLNTEQFNGLSKQVLALSKDIGKPPGELAEALYQVISAGVPASEAMQFLETATKASIGGVTDTTTAVDGLTTVLNAFQMQTSEAGHVANVMFTTVKGGKTTFAELSASLFNVAPVAAVSGLRFEEVAAALASLTKQGTPTSVATTQLRAAMLALQRPTSDMAKVVRQSGYASGQAMVEELGLAKTLNVLRESTRGSNDMLIKMFGSIEAGQAVLGLTGDKSSMYASDLEAMSRASKGAGAATEAYNEMNKSTSRQFEILQTKIKATSVEIGAALLPALKPLVAMATPMIQATADFTERHSTLSAVLLASATAGGGFMVLLAILPKIQAGYVALTATVNAHRIATAKTAAVQATTVVKSMAAATAASVAYAVKLTTVVIPAMIGQLAAMGPAGWAIIAGVAAATVAGIVAIKKAMGLAKGGRVTEEGYFEIGENGPELLRLPVGSEVFPLGKAITPAPAFASPYGGASGAGEPQLVSQTVTNHFHFPNVTSVENYKDLAEELVRKQRKAERSLGIKRNR